MFLHTLLELKGTLQKMSSKPASKYNARSGVLLWFGDLVSSSSTVIAQTLPKNCVRESPRVTVKWYLALVTSLTTSRYAKH